MSTEIYNISGDDQRKGPDNKELDNRMEKLTLIAQRVGGDFNMKVKLGQPGQGSFFNPQNVEVTLDPDHVLKEPDEAKFVTAHEGAHRAITKSPKEIGLSDEKVNEFYGQVGFGFIDNAIEDPAVNGWFCERFPGLKDCTRSTYDKQFKEEGAVLSTPEVQKIAQQLGYWPKFSQFGSEVIRNWHQGRFSHNLDKDVEAALNKTRDDFEKSIKTVPNPKGFSEKENIEKRQERFSINTEKVWPEVKKLIEDDIQNENQRQIAQAAGSKTQEIEEMQKQSSDQGGDQGDAKEKMKQLQEDLDASGLSQDALEEIKEATQKAGSGSGKSRERSDKQEVDKNQGKVSGASLEKDKDFGDPISWDELSEKTKEELKKAFEKLSQDKKEELQKESERRLKELEDKLNDALDGKLNENKPESHKIRQEQEERGSQEARMQEDKDNARKQSEDQHERIKEKLREKMYDEMTNYERTRAKQMYLIDSLYHRLKRILKPEEQVGAESGYPSGGTPDIVRAMQADHDITQKAKMWARENDPERKDYRFWHLIDNSGSMSGEPINEVYKGFVVAFEAINRVEDYNSDKICIKQGATSFNGRIEHCKDYAERLNSEVEEKLSDIKNTKGSTNTDGATKFALNKMQQDLGTSGNFLLTFTDGEPDDSEELIELIESTKEMRKRNKIKLGIIWLVDDDDDDDDEGYEARGTLGEIIKHYGYDFGLVMSTREFSQSERERGKRNFSEKLSDLLEDIIENPEKYE